MKNAGLMKGYPDGSFHPNQGLTRAEVVNVINTLLNRPKLELGESAFSDVAKKDWFWVEIQSASQLFSIKRNDDGTSSTIINP